MESTALDTQLKAARGKVLGGIALGIVTLGLWIMVFFQILFSFFESVEWLPLAVNIIVDVLAVVLTVVSIKMLRDGLMRLSELQDEQDIEGLESVVGELPEVTQPMRLDEVLAALLRLNDLDLPYSVEVDRDGDTAKVRVPWRIEELKWRTLMTRGSQVRRWQLELTLDGNRGRYRFSEVSSWHKLVGSGATASLSAAAGRSRSKSFAAGSVTKVWAVGDVLSPEGRGSSGRIGIKPSDAKVPVFRILRAYGWRPRRDSLWHQLWEY